MMARIRSKVSFGPYIYVGKELDAVVSPNGKFAGVFDEQNFSWHFNEMEFEIIEPGTIVKPEVNTTPSNKTINDFFSQEMSEMTVRFK